MFIQNCGRRDIEIGFHKDPGPNAVLIQISDPPGDHPIPKHKFAEVYQFDFLDIEDHGMTNDGTGELVCMKEFVITDEQAQQIGVILEQALIKGQNVIVHCNAGICRSGAVCEVGVAMGFEDTERFRNPNLTVKRKLMQQLGNGY